MSAATQTPVFLGSLLQGIASVPDAVALQDIALTDITLDSRQVIPGGVFLACRGEHWHGMDFAADVARRGAAVILFEPENTRIPDLPSNIIVAAVPNLAARASLLADRFFASPSRQLDVIGVTGTNGKTTCAWLLAQALTACDHPAAYLGTLGTSFAGHAVAGELTTPDAITVQRQLAGFAAQGAAAVAMEVSSHALAQHRVAAVHFDAAVFTNLTRDHLDFHRDMQSYGLAKASLFERDDIRLRVFNVDDSFGAALAARPQFSARITCSSRGHRSGVARHAGVDLAGRFLRAHSIAYSVSGTRFTLDSSFGNADVETPLIGSFNVDNVLAVMAVLLGSNLSLAKCVAAMRDLVAPSGRLETFTAPGMPLVVVDSAHTPDALQKALEVLRQHCKGRLSLVFGCGGDRDSGKRPLMGALAVRLADDVILTDDNPRNESGDGIIGDIRAGMGARPITIIRDRESAIREAVANARCQDVVLVAGKGHETYQIVGDMRRPFSDQAVARSALGMMQNIDPQVSA
ncbi:MAG: UDP-N-acetylmuramoyl-L-alanyl-D-glutamate--2,6-diaminopimelate ligase [Pseudomonadota bacterium]